MAMATLVKAALREQGRDALSLDLSPDGYVAVPVAELEKLEQSRRDIFTHLQEHVGSLMLLELTGQIWKIANRKKWD